jgi:hypothetical protein
LKTGMPLPQPRLRLTREGAGRLVACCRIDRWMAIEEGPETEAGANVDRTVVKRSGEERPGSRAGAVCEEGTAQLQQDARGCCDRVLKL